MRPVTQLADVAVKKASMKFVQLPSLEEMGSMRSSAPIRINVIKPRSIVWAPDILCGFLLLLFSIG